MSRSSLPVALTIAGSDSGGGAGIQADLRTFHAFGAFGTSAVTAITAQNTMGVTAVHPVPIEVVRAQIDAVVDDLAPTAVKTGMLATAPLVEAVARALGDHGLTRYVLDPVMVSSTGARLLDEDAVGAVASLLVPLCALVTPNLEEAAILVGTEIRDPGGQRAAARTLIDMGARAALVKGGHGEGGEIVDFLMTSGGEERTWRRPRIDTPHTHGTGCTLSAGVAGGLAADRPLEDAVDRAIRFTVEAIRTAPGIGRGHGPINHFADL